MQCLRGWWAGLFLGIVGVTGVQEGDGGEVVFEHFLAVLLEFVCELVDPLHVG